MIKAGEQKIEFQNFILSKQVWQEKDPATIWPESLSKGSETQVQIQQTPKSVGHNSCVSLRETFCFLKIYWLVFLFIQDSGNPILICGHKGMIFSEVWLNSAVLIHF
jgi:hypothetical protein